MVARLGRRRHRLAPACVPVGAVAQAEGDIELAGAMGAVVDRVGPQPAGLGTLKLHVMIGASPFDDRIEALTGPGQHVTKRRAGDGVATVAEALRGHQEVLAEGVRLDESGALLLVSKPEAQGLSDGGVA
jgi:hypothetical protein